MDNILCILFGHKLGEWEYVDEDSCQQVRKCKRDSFQESRSMPHQFGAWEYSADKSCQQIRICKRDGYKETRVIHQFSEWGYVANSSCEQIQRCTRDGYVEKRIVHQFGEWMYVNHNTCEQVRSCGRDNYEERRIEHDWEDIGHEEFDKEASDAATYERGGYITSGDPSITIYKTVITERRCKRCHESEVVEQS